MSKKFLVVTVYNFLSAFKVRVNETDKKKVDPQVRIINLSLQKLLRS
jgi:hypothetical protein